MIGLFLGDTDFSDIVLSKIKKQNIEYFIIDFSKKNKFKKDKHSFKVSIGKFGEIINLINQKNCKKVLFAGKILKPNLSSIRLDLKGIYYMPSVIRAAKIGDAAIIKSIIKILNNEGIKVISSIFFNPELSLKKGNYSKIKPNKQDIISIKKGRAFFSKTKSLDHIQALVVKGNKILAKEGREGTKKMLAKLKKKSEGILIKLPKKKQDLRMDLPTIGLQTLKDIKKYGLRVWFYNLKKTFLDKAKCIKFANKNNIL